MRTSVFRSVLAWTALVIVAAGCVHFRPLPVSPAGTLDAFEARTLDRADLGDYLRTKRLAVAWPLNASAIEEKKHE